MEVHISSRFKKSFRKLDPRVQKKAVDKTALFRNDPFASNLGTHKLHGEKKEEWAFSVDYSYRISFIFVGNGDILLTDIGTHDMYK
jgi:mRNA-degrading endonuclease YafQ of YafQ-DinJ toxin-antitoxin module